MKTQTKIDEVPVQAHRLDDLVVAAASCHESRSLVVEVSAPDLDRNDDEEDDADRHVRAVEAGDHEKGRAELRRAPRVAPGTDALRDELGPFERLHADERRAKRGGGQQQPERRLAIPAVAIVDRECHRAAAGDQHEGHDRDQQQRDVPAEQVQREHHAGIRPRHGRRAPHRHVGDQEAAEDEGVADEEDPHHRLAPGHALEGALVRREVGDDASRPFAVSSPPAVPTAVFDAMGFSLPANR